MNTLYKRLFSILIVLIIYNFAFQKSALAQQDRVDFQVFYDELSPYGQWVDYPDYGYVWMPDAGPDFSPYSTNGNWVMTEYGWTWVSNYDWGWAPFHYGRWDYNDYYGWFWIADYEWGPSWVIWRRANGYYGWTPMGPGTNVNGNFSVGYQDPYRWNFVQDQYFGRYDMDRYYSPRSDINVIIVNSTVINNTYIDRGRHTTYVTGPRKAEVQANTGRRFNSLAVRDNSTPGVVLNNNQLKIYRPVVERTRDGNRKPAPTRIANIKEVRPAKERVAADQRQPSDNPVQQQQQQLQKVNQVQQQPRSNNAVLKTKAVEQQQVKRKKKTTLKESGTTETRETKIKKK